MEQRGFSGNFPPTHLPAPELTEVLAQLDPLINWERRDRDAAMRVDLEPVRALLQALNNPHAQLRCVHVTGSKGKGSVCAWIEAGLTRLGASVGVYSSPHVEVINERIRLLGKSIEDLALARALKISLAARERCADNAGAHATWFDLVTAAGFYALRQAKVDWSVIEVGMGGRLDSTNVVLPEVCVLTNVELEHTGVLGKTRAAIAREKAGIAKPGVPFVTGLDPSDEAGQVLAERAAECSCKVTWLALERDLPIGERNRRLAGASLDVLGQRLGQAELNGRLLEDALPPRLPGRMEHFVVRGIPVVLDGAHTPGSLRAVLSELAREPELLGRPVVVFGVGRDKDLLGLLKLLAPVAESLICSSTGTGLALPKSEVAEKARGLGLDVETASDPRGAILEALQRARSAWVLVTGSLHLVGAVRRHLALL